MDNVHRQKAWSLLTWALVLLIVALGVFMRVYGLSGEAPHGEEVSSLRHIGAPNAAAYFRNLHRFNPEMVPVYFLLQYAWWQLSHGNLVAVRLLSVAFGIACIPLAFLFARRYFGATAGIVAALCIAFSFPLAKAHQEIRMYALFYFLTLLSAYSLFLGLDTDRKGWWLVHGVCNTLLVWTHIMSVLFLLVEGLLLAVLWRHHRRRLLLWYAVHAIWTAMLIVWILVSWAGLRRTSNWIREPTLTSLLDALLQGGVTPCPGAEWLPRVLQGFLLALVLWLLLRASGLVRRPDAQTEPHVSPGHASVLSFLFLWLTVPSLVLFVLSLTWKSCFAARYTLHSAQALYLIAGAGVAALPTRFLRTLAVALLAVAYGYHAMLVPRPLRPDWCAIASQIENERRPEDSVIVYKVYSTQVLCFVSPTLAPDVQNAPEYADIQRAIRPETRENHTAWVVVNSQAHVTQFENHLNRWGETWDARTFRQGWPYGIVALYRFGTAQE